MHSPQPGSRALRGSYLLDGLLLYLLAAFLIWPLFAAGYLDLWGSIESTFIAHARFLIEHWPHPQWQPLWYCGTRFDYIYPPALPYGTAIISLFLGTSLVHAYHLYVAAFYCLGVTALYVFVRGLSGSRAMALGAGVLHLLVSPSFPLLPKVAIDAGERFLCPQRLNALVRWGEGPHISALAVIPLGLACAYWAMTRKSLPALGAAAVFCALAVSNNFYGGVTLAILYPLLVWCVWVTHQDHSAWLRAAIIPVLAYGLTAVWLVPSYLRETTANLITVEASGRASDAAIAVAIGLLFLAASYFYGRFRKDLCYPLFVIGGALFFTVAVIGTEWFDLRVFGSAMRFIPELDLFLILAWLELCREIWNRLVPRQRQQLLAWQGAAIVVAMMPLYLALTYLPHAWRIYKPYPDYQSRIEYRVPQWISENLPDGRVYVEGSIRFWYNAWRDLPQLTGGSHQGASNQMLAAVEWNLRSAESGEWAKEWMQAYGVDAAVVSDSTSQDVYPTLLDPRKFDGVLPVLWNSGKGDVIYRVPRRFPAHARVVDEAALEQLLPISDGWLRERLQAYVKVVERGPTSEVMLRWHGPETVIVNTSLEMGQILLLQESYDPAWHAYVDDKQIEIREDMVGNMLVAAPPGEHEIRMQFETPLENWIGRLLTALSALAVIALCVSPRRLVPTKQEVPQRRSKLAAGRRAQA